MNTTVYITTYGYDITVECLDASINPNEYTSANVSIYNYGIFEGDIQVNFWIEDSIGTTYSSDSTIINISQDQTWYTVKSLLVPSYASSGTYYFMVRVNVSNYNNTNFCTFEVTVPTVPPPEVPPSAPPGAPPEEPEKLPTIELKYLTNHIVIPTVPKEYTIEIKNSGELDLHNLTLYIQGLEFDWYSIEPEILDLGVDEIVVFTINYTVPETAQIKTYSINFLIKTDELEKRVPVTLSVIEVKKRSDLEQKIEELEREIRSLEMKIEELRKEGISTDMLTRLLFNAKEKVYFANKELEMGNFEKASELVYEAEILIDLIKDMIIEITYEPIRAIPWTLLLLIFSIVFVILVVALKYYQEDSLRKINQLYQSLEKEKMSYYKGFITKNQFSRREKEINEKIEELEIKVIKKFGTEKHLKLYYEMEAAYKDRIISKNIYLKSKEKLISDVIKKRHKK